MPERAGGGWYPDNPPSAVDHYVKWLNGRQDTPGRRAEFAKAHPGLAEDLRALDEEE